jgi:hypothetical protein
LAVETLAETFTRSPWLRGRRNKIVLARRPVIEIVAINVGDVVIDPDDYLLDGASGTLERTGAGACELNLASTRSNTVVTYRAGWTLPPETNFTLPLDIEGALIGMIRSARFAADRDPAVKSEWTTDIERIDYWVGQIGENGAFPPDIASSLDPFCYEPEF